MKFNGFGYCYCLFCGRIAHTQHNSQLRSVVIVKLRQANQAKASAQGKVTEY